VTTLHDFDGEQLARAELDHDRVLLVAEHPGTALWAAAIRQADQVVLVASAWTSAPELWDGPQGADLVLVGKLAGATELATWCDRLAPRQLWQSATGRTSHDLRVLVDRIGGRSLGLVLAGGGARAMTSIGVLLELEASGLHVDRLAGTSLGAIVAGLYATGISAEQLLETSYAEFVRHNPFGDYTVPTTALTKGQRTIDALRRHLGDHRIETLPRLFRCVSTDLYAREP
jgi:NTE family protein